MRALFWLALFGGGEALAADKGDSAVVAVVMDREDGTVLSADRPTAAVVRELDRRGWMAAPLDVASAFRDLEHGSTAARLQAATSAGGGEVIVLVEAEAHFYAQVAGRYRWTVSADVTVAPIVGGGEPLQRRVEVPVFLVYDHEREADALAEASAMLARKVGIVARDFRDSER